MIAAAALAMLATLAALAMMRDHQRRNKDRPP